MRQARKGHWNFGKETGWADRKPEEKRERTHVPLPFFTATQRSGPIVQESSVCFHGLGFRFGFFLFLRRRVVEGQQGFACDIGKSGRQHKADGRQDPP